MTDLSAARALADDLVSGFPGGKPGILEMQGLRELHGMYDGDDLGPAIDAFQARLEELTGHRTPPAADPGPPTSRRPSAPAADPVDTARDLIGAAFAAPLDGSEARLDVLAARARGAVAHLVDAGLSPQDRERLIEEEKAQARLL